MFVYNEVAYGVRFIHLGETGGIAQLSWQAEYCRVHSLVYKMFTARL